MCDVLAPVDIPSAISENGSDSGASRPTVASVSTNVDEILKRVEQQTPAQRWCENTLKHLHPFDVVVPYDDAHTQLEFEKMFVEDAFPKRGLLPAIDQFVQQRTKLKLAEFPEFVDNLCTWTRSFGISSTTSTFGLCADTFISKIVPERPGPSSWVVCVSDVAEVAILMAMENGVTAQWVYQAIGPAKATFVLVSAKRQRNYVWPYVSIFSVAAVWSIDVSCSVQEDLLTVASMETAPLPTASAGSWNAPKCTKAPHPIHQLPSQWIFDSRVYRMSPYFPRDRIVLNASYEAPGVRTITEFLMITLGTGSSKPRPSGGTSSPSAATGMSSQAAQGAAQSSHGAQSAATYVPASTLPVKGGGSAPPQVSWPLKKVCKVREPITVWKAAMVEVAPQTLEACLVRLRLDPGVQWIGTHEDGKCRASMATVLNIFTFRPHVTVERPLAPPADAGSAVVTTTTTTTVGATLVPSTVAASKQTPLETSNTATTYAVSTESTLRRRRGGPECHSASDSPVRPAHHARPSSIRSTAATGRRGHSTLQDDKFFDVKYAPLMPVIRTTMSHDSISMSLETLSLRRRKARQTSQAPPATHVAQAAQASKRAPRAKCDSDAVTVGDIDDETGTDASTDMSNDVGNSTEEEPIYDNSSSDDGVDDGSNTETIRPPRFYVANTAAELNRTLDMVHNIEDPDKVIVTQRARPEQLELQHFNECHAIFDRSFVYRVGQVVQPVSGFDRSDAPCGHGIHFFHNIKAAMKYDGRFRFLPFVN